ncbi:MAG TPA: triple tyrosine motif-containing protein, partial [Longimicrobiales bacterium]|nr:triple tyrosine motif-containing protein [Longimicrobiales bacterium]
DFAALDFRDVSLNRYRYRLEGLDEEWIDARNDPTANYTSVPAGDYTFRVAARNSEGVWNEAGLSIPLRVQAPFYETAWFRSGVVLALLLVISALYWYRLSQLTARQNLRFEIAGRLHDDIGANLSSIALKTEMVRGAETFDERRRKQLGDVGRLARETVDKVRETVWVVNTRYDTLSGLVGKMRDTADVILAGQVSYDVDVEPEELPDRRISMEFRQNVHLLFKEALNNVVKHAEATRVDIRITYHYRHLGFRVTDDGIGFDPADESRGNGLILMRQRADLCRGRLDFLRRPEGGTTVDFRAPAK